MALLARCGDNLHKPMNGKEAKTIPSGIGFNHGYRLLPSPACLFGNYRL
jgi:hypothetical protein